MSDFYLRNTRDFRGSFFSSELIARRFGDWSRTNAFARRTFRSGFLSGRLIKISLKTFCSFLHLGQQRPPSSPKEQFTLRNGVVFPAVGNLSTIKEICRGGNTSKRPSPSRFHFFLDGGGGLKLSLGGQRTLHCVETDGGEEQIILMHPVTLSPPPLEGPRLPLII